MWVNTVEDRLTTRAAAAVAYGLTQDLGCVSSLTEHAMIQADGTFVWPSAQAPSQPALLPGSSCLL